MRSTVQFIIFAALIYYSAAVSPLYNVTSGLEDYTLLVGRQMQNELDIGDLKMATVKARHANRMEAVASQQELVLQEIHQFDNLLVQHQAFSLSRKHCIQKYKPRLTTFNQASVNVTSCLNEAALAGEGFTKSADASLKNARNIREVDVPGIFTMCNENYSESALENCVLENIDVKAVQFNKHMDIFEIALREGLYMSSVIATEATRCSFVVEKKVLTTNGAFLDLTDLCVEDLKGNEASAPVVENKNDAEKNLILRLLSRSQLRT